MANDLQITTEGLRQVFEILISHLEENGVRTVDIPHDYYWHVFSKERYNVYEKPDVSALGSLFDDWGDLKKVLDGEHEPLAYHFVDLAPILRAIGEQYIG